MAELQRETIETILEHSELFIALRTYVLEQVYARSSEGENTDKWTSNAWRHAQKIVGIVNRYVKRADVVTRSKNEFTPKPLSVSTAAKLIEMGTGSDYALKAKEQEIKSLKQQIVIMAKVMGQMQGPAENHIQLHGDSSQKRSRSTSP